MLIISIMSLLRKKTKLRFAYSLLAMTSLSLIAHDAKVRSDLCVGSSEAQRTQFIRPAPPLPITPLAQSPFAEARPGSILPRETAIARTGQPPATLREKRIVPSSVCFLTVAVTVASGARPVALNRGTRVHLVREQDGKFLVRRNGTDFLVEKTQVTDDIGSLTKLARTSS